MRPTVIAFLVNGDTESPAGFRARTFAKHLKDEYSVIISYRSGNKKTAIFHFWRFLCRHKPALTYVFDMAYSGVIAGLLYKTLFHNRVLIDTGDSIFALARSMGTRGRLGLCLTRILEFCSLRFADQIVVRGTVHKRQLSSSGLKVEVVQDGVESELFCPLDVTDLRRQYGLHRVVTVGLVGSITWNPRLEMCYGTELVEAIAMLKHLPIEGVIIGDGSGLETLRQNARKLGVEGRIHFLGRVPYHALPRYLNLIDICISTQTNDAVGQVRTTGKLPLYLATGRYVLASRVGEAAILLPENMLVDYENTKDIEYPKKLAEKIQLTCENPQTLYTPDVSRSLALQHFDYAFLARRVSDVLATLLPKTITQNLAAKC